MTVRGNNHDVSYDVFWTHGKYQRVPSNNNEEASLDEF